ncbi:MAG: hypothetical protein KKA42_12990 [candidate division Zixibacteria bacterium]|nr:hypothetical protein [candidate division Zixibacteria bacterium]
MKKHLPLTIVLVFVFVFVFTMTLQVFALSQRPDPPPPPPPVICCTFTNSCGGVGYGSMVEEICYDQLGKPYVCYNCRYLYPWQPDYDPMCIYMPAPSCNQQ